MDKTIELGAVDLTVADLDRSLDYYTRGVGMQVCSATTPAGPGSACRDGHWSLYGKSPAPCSHRRPAPD
jgi:catechol 2,3-dioxygenase-like lactoylglutathione lyase family enzyme